MTEPAAAAGTVNDVLAAQDPILLRIAASLLAKAERSSGERAVRLKLDRRELPELYDQVHAEAVGRVELLLREIERTGWVRLILTRERDFAGFADRKPQLELIDFDALADWAGYRRLAESWQRRLVAHLEQHWRDPGAERKRALLEYLIRSPLAALAALPAEEAMSSLQALAALCRSGVAMPLREASARVFQGRSKVLDSRDELLRLLGAGPGQFWEAPIQLLLDIPPAFDEALFVENLVTFERMADARGADWQHSLLIYAAGFKGSAKRLRHRNGCRVYLRASHADALALEPLAVRGLEAVDAWLFGKSDLPVRFFGDLDFSGMQILGSLREVFAQAAAWQPGYAKLAALLSDGHSHAPEAAGKERQGDPGTTGCNYADRVLLPLMRQSGRFVDQEGFGAAEA